MSSDIGLTLEEKIRRSLPPLGGPLRIDSFVAVMIRERARIAAERIGKSRTGSAKTPAAPAGDPAVEESLTGEGPAVSTGPREATPADDSGKIKAEVDAFLRRDERRDATPDEVTDYLDYLGPSGLNPGDLPET